MAMFGREVMLSSSLMAKPPEEPITSSVPLVIGLRDALSNADEKSSNGDKTGHMSPTKILLRKVSSDKISGRTMGLIILATTAHSPEFQEITQIVDRAIE